MMYQRISYRIEPLYSLSHYRIRRTAWLDKQAIIYGSLISLYQNFYVTRSYVPLEVSYYQCQSTLVAPMFEEKKLSLQEGRIIKMFDQIV